MNDSQRLVLSEKLRLPERWWREALQNPLWYVVAIVGLVGLSVYIPVLRWLAGAIALIWGGWLIWLLFVPEPKEAITEEPVQAYLEQALIYKAQLHQLLDTTSNRHNDQGRQRLAGRIETWIETIAELVQQITMLRQDDLLCRDLVAAPQSLRLLEVRLAQETDPVLQAQLKRALQNRQKQVASLTGLEKSLSQAELQVENTLSQLGTLYSQLLTDQSIHQVVDNHRLSIDLEEAVDQLQDQLVALTEVKRMAQTTNFTHSAF